MMILGSLELIRTERPDVAMTLSIKWENGMLANLQALRALAAIAVVVFHFGLMPPTSLMTMTSAKDEEEKAKKEADARAAAARKRALPKKRRLRPELSPLKAGQAKTVSIQEPPKEKKVIDVNTEDEGDLWDAILNDDAPSAPPIVTEQKKATHYGHISPEKSVQMQRPMRDVVAEQKARWKKKREQEKRARMDADTSVEGRMRKLENATLGVAERHAKALETLITYTYPFQQRGVSMS